MSVIAHQRGNIKHTALESWSLQQLRLARSVLVTQECHRWNPIHTHVRGQSLYWNVCSVWLCLCFPPNCWQTAIPRLQLQLTPYKCMFGTCLRLQMHSHGSPPCLSDWCLVCCSCPFTGAGCRVSVIVCVVTRAQLLLLGLIICQPKPKPRMQGLNVHTPTGCALSE